LSRKLPQPLPGGIRKPTPPPAPPRTVTPKNMKKNPWLLKFNELHDPSYLGELHFENGHLILHQPDHPYAEEVKIDLGDLNNSEGMQQVLTTVIAKRLLIK
jgi:hypothetical protein